MLNSKISMAFSKGPLPRSFWDLWDHVFKDFPLKTMPKIHPPQHEHFLAKRRFFKTNSFQERLEMKGRLYANIYQIIKEPKIPHSFEQNVSPAWWLVRCSRSTLWLRNSEIYRINKANFREFRSLAFIWPTLVTTRKHYHQWKLLHSLHSHWYLWWVYETWIEVNFFYGK